jgi:hypothetical protein
VPHVAWQQDHRHDEARLSRNYAGNLRHCRHSVAFALRCAKIETIIHDRFVAALQIELCGDILTSGPIDSSVDATALHSEIAAFRI